MRTISYISEITLPSSSAYAQHVLKISDTFSKFYKTNLFLFSSNGNYKAQKKKYLLKNKFNIIPYKKKISKISFLKRLRYSYWVKNKIEVNSLVLSRSILASLVLSLYKIKNILELHHPPSGITKYIFNFFRFFKLDSSIKYILISKNLSRFMKIEKSIVLDDAVDIQDYIKYKTKKIKYEFTYIGSLFNGKGFEVIDYLSQNFPKNKFYVFGDLTTLDKTIYNLDILKLRKNLFLKGYIEYKKIPKILSMSKFLLMPYQNKVHVNSKDLEVSNFMSPLKLFDYLASSQIIIASKMQVYSHILKDNYNSILVNNSNLNNWKKKINFVLKNKNTLSYLGINSKKLAFKYTWDKRVKKIIEWYNN
tara:strand:- start:2320 stop:3408 length:1089 start_codon:yes stop_codon:yes gene_type:complete